MPRTKPATIDYDNLEILWLQVAMQTLHNESVGKYIRFPSEFAAIQRIVGAALRDIRRIDAPEPRACPPPFCTNGRTCEPCGLTESARRRGGAATTAARVALGRKGRQPSPGVAAKRQ